MPTAETRKLLGHVAVAAAIGLNLLWIPCLGVTFDVILMSVTVSRGPLAALAATAALAAYIYTFVSLMTPRSSPRWRFRALVTVIWSGVFLLTQVSYWILYWDSDYLRYPVWIALMMVMALGPIATITAWRLRRGEIVAPNTCTQCGYDLRGNPQGLACPECGAPVPPWSEAGPLPPPRLGRRRLVIGLVIVYLLWVGYATFERYRLRREMERIYQALNRGDIAILDGRMTSHFQAGAGSTFADYFADSLHPDDDIIFYGVGATTTHRRLFGVVESDNGTIWVHTPRGWLLDETHFSVD